MHDVWTAGQVLEDLQERDKKGRSKKPPRELRIHRQLTVSRTRARPAMRMTPCCPTRMPDMASSGTWTETTNAVHVRGLHMRCPILVNPKKKRPGMRGLRKFCGRRALAPRHDLGT